MKMRSHPQPYYPKHPGSAKGVNVIKSRVDRDRESEPRDAEQAQRILTEETPKKIERLRQEFRDLYLGERGRASRGDGQEQAA